MRWQPETSRCAECGFSWATPARDAIDVARNALVRIDAAVEGGRPRPELAPVSPGGWSPGEYVWHLVDVVRMGTERLWTVQLDPGVGLVCWDENELARVRQYGQLSMAVGLRALRAATEAWIDELPPVDLSAIIRHDAQRTMTADDIVRRTAHEIQHHALDIERLIRR